MPNRLANETSPYLLQHADNPVDWFPWGEEALQRARDEDKPIFLSIGYSACHWCHVMAHESFEDDGIAQVLNDHYVNIKVDREERPDLDRIYMNAVQALTGGGGWPMSVFLTPDGHPFYGGTYFPPQPRYGMPSFTQVLRAIIDGWRDRRAELISSGQGLVEAIERQNTVNSGHRRTDLHRDTLYSAFRALQQRFDRVYGGWGEAPKFPQPMALEFLLRFHHNTGDTDALDMVTRTLEAMARGGMYDQLGGGFHRYSVDDRWLVPHFEKMLYDESQLARVYLHAWQVTGNDFFRTITEEILDYVVREMTDPAGGFYSTQDADSEGEEGKFFVWTPDEIRDVLGEEADAFMTTYGVTRHGNFEGKNILEFVGDIEQRPALAEAREAARALNRDDYRRVAERNADFLLRELRQENGRLVRTWKACPEQVEGAGETKLNGYLEDYSYLVEGLLELYQTTFEPRCSRHLAEVSTIPAMITRRSSPAPATCRTMPPHRAMPWPLPSF
jgi:uncharacterized protein YyaL (SSP411 family)